MPTATERVFLASPSTGRVQAALSAPWLFTGEDNLRLVIINSQAGVVVTLDGRQLGPDDTRPQAFTQTFTPTSDRTMNTFDFQFGVGFLLNCSLIVTSGAPLIGQTYCMLQVIRGLTGSRVVLGCLVAGYITAMQHIAYPGSPIESSTAGEPFVRVIVGTTPAAGAEISETVPTGARWELLTFYYLLTTSAVAGARSSLLRFRSAANDIIAQVQPAATQAANIQFAYTWGQNLPAVAIISQQLTQALPLSLILPAGAKIGTFSPTSDPADQYGGIRYIVREWLEAA